MNYFKYGVIYNIGYVFFMELRCWRVCGFASVKLSFSDIELFPWFIICRAWRTGGGI
jgi:hypothetical protein